MKLTTSVQLRPRYVTHGGVPSHSNAPSKHDDSDNFTDAFTKASGQYVYCYYYIELLCDSD